MFMRMCVVCVVCAHVCLYVYMCICVRISVCIYVYACAFAYVMCVSGERIYGSLAYWRCSLLFDWMNLCVSVIWLVLGVRMYLI